MSEVDFDLLLDAVSTAIALPEEDFVAQPLPVRQPPRAANDNQSKDKDNQIKTSIMIEQACDFLVLKAGDAPAAPVLAGTDEPDGLTCYKKALAAIEAAAVKDPDNAELKARKAALSAKIEAQQPPAK